MISIGRGYKPLYCHKRNRDKLSELGSSMSFPVDYGEKNSKNNIKLTLENMGDYKD